MQIQEWQMMKLIMSWQKGKKFDQMIDELQGDKCAQFRKKEA